MEENETIEIGQRIPVWGEMLKVIKSDRRHPFCDSRCVFFCDGNICTKPEYAGPCWSTERIDKTDVVFVKSR